MSLPPARDALATLIAQADELVARPDADWAAAARVVESALALAPNEAPLYLRLAEYRRCCGDYRGAVAALDRMVDIKPGEAASYRARSVMRWHLFDFAGAAADARRALALDVRDPSAWLALAEALRCAGDFGAAKEAADSAIAAGAGSWAWVVRGKIGRDCGDLGGAMGDLDTALRLEPRSAKALGWMGLVLRQGGRPSEALDLLTRAAALDVNSAWLAFLRGELKREAGDLTGSWCDITTAAGQDPHAGCDFDMLGAPDRSFYRDRANAWVHGWVGESLRRKDSAEKALFHLDLSLELEPRLYWALVWRGQLLRAQGRLADARRDFAAALELHPDLSAARCGLSEGPVSVRAVARAPAARVPDLNEAFEALPLEWRGMEHLLGPRSARYYQALHGAGPAKREGVYRDETSASGLAEKGRLLHLCGRTLEAQKTLERALELAPGSSRPLACLGSFWTPREPELAVRYLESAVEADPGQAWPRLWLAVARLMRGRHEDFESAQADLARFEEASGPAAPAAFFSALAHYAAGDYGKSFDSARQLIKMEPGSAAGYFLLSQALLTTGDYAEAMAAFDQARDRDPECWFFDPSRFGLPRRQRKADDPAWLEALDRALGTHPACVFLLVEKAEALRSPAFCRYELALETYRRAQSLGSRSAWFLAYFARAESQILGLRAGLRRLDEALARCPGAGWIRAWRGETLRRLGRHEEALADFDSAVSLMPSYGYAYAWRGALLAGLKQDALAQESLDAALCLGVTFPTSALARHARGQVRRRLGDVSGALADVTAAFLEDPKYSWIETDAAVEEHREGIAELDALLSHEPGSWAYAWRGRCRFAARELAGALADFDRACALDSSNAWALAWKAEALSDAGDRPAAAEAAARALARKPGLSSAALIIADAKLRAGAQEEALAVLGECERHAPTTVSLHARKGEILLDAARPGEAAVSFQRALALNPRQARIHALLARARLDLEDYAAAAESAEQALDLEPEMTLARLVRALARGKSGDFQGQIADFQRLFELDPTLFQSAPPEVLSALRPTS